MLEPLKMMCQGGFMMETTSGRRQHVYPMPAAWNTDILEKHDASLVSSYPHPLCDVATMANLFSATNPDAPEPPRRTEKGMRAAIMRAVAAKEDGEEDRAAQMLNNVGTRFPVMPAGAGFGRGINIYQLLGYPDRLHQSDKGVMLHLLKLLQSRLTKPLQRAINESLFADPPYPGVKLPSDGLTALKATASEQRALFMLILVPLLAAAQHEGVLPIMESMTAYLEWDTMRDSYIHTEDTLQALQDLHKRFLRTLPAGKNWNILKIMAMAAYPRTIREMGSASITSSAPGEASHRYLKLAALHSNRHQETHLEQVGKEVLRQDTITQLHARRATAQRNQVTKGFVNKARLLGGVVFARPTATVYYIKGAPQPHLQSVRPGQPELALHFEEALSSFIGVLADAGSASPLVPDDDKVSIVSSMGMQYEKHRGAERDAVGLHVCHAYGPAKRDSFPFIAVRGEDAEDGTEVTWFCRLQLLFTFVFRGVVRRAAFVQWLVTAPSPGSPRSTAAAAHRALRMQRLRWEKRGEVQPYSVISADSFRRPVCIQADPTTQDSFYYNHFVR